MTSSTNSLKSAMLWALLALMACAMAFAAAAQDGNSGSAQRAPGAGGRDLDGPYLEGPSEDGTDDETDSARPGEDAPGLGAPGFVIPEQPPGCRFRNGPLELVV